MNGTPERRARILGDEDIEAIRTQFYGSDITPKEHTDHHLRWREHLQKEQSKAIRMERLRSTVIGSMIVGAMGSIGGALYWIGTYFREHWK